MKSLQSTEPQAWPSGSFHSGPEPWAMARAASSCGARAGFLPRRDEDLREPLVRRQGSQVSMRACPQSLPASESFPMSQLFA